MSGRELSRALPASTKRAVLTPRCARVARPIGRTSNGATSAPLSRGSPPAAPIGSLPAGTEARGQRNSATEELSWSLRWMIRWRVPRSVPCLLPCLKRYRRKSSGRSSAESSAPSSVTSGDGSSGTSLALNTTLEKHRRRYQPLCPPTRKLLLAMSTRRPQAQLSAACWPSGEPVFRWTARRVRGTDAASVVLSAAGACQEPPAEALLRGTSAPIRRSRSCMPSIQARSCGR